MKGKGLTGFELKLIGLVLMVFDHIYEFFYHTNILPIAFKWVGRIVSPRKAIKATFQLAVLVTIFSLKNA